MTVRGVPQAAVNLDPLSSAAYNNLAIVYGRLSPQKTAAAMSAYRAALGLSPHQHQSHFNLAQLLIDHEAYHAAYHPITNPTSA